MDFIIPRKPFSQLRKRRITVYLSCRNKKILPLFILFKHSPFDACKYNILNPCFVRCKQIQFIFIIILLTNIIIYNVNYCLFQKAGLQPLSNRKIWTHIRMKENLAKKYSIPKQYLDNSCLTIAA